ncbi:MAG: hypothetical protein IPJ88_16840 [Myxococcales bacterium]|nr:MAG: hypothetical protein IPJ88_16840 [Myxococcales bacterium]
MRSWRSMTWLRIASFLALLALGLITWSFLDPSPFLMILFMSVGQGIGTLSKMIFLVVVIHDALLRPSRLSAEQENEEQGSKTA